MRGNVRRQYLRTLPGCREVLFGDNVGLRLASCCPTKEIKTQADRTGLII